MRYVVVENFKYGLDSRRIALASQPGTLVTLENAHINQGGEVEKRKAFSLQIPLVANTYGFEATEDGLVVFIGLPDGQVPPDPPPVPPALNMNPPKFDETYYDPVTAGYTPPDPSLSQFWFGLSGTVLGLGPERGSVGGEDNDMKWLAFLLLPVLAYGQNSRLQWATTNDTPDLDAKVISLIQSNATSATTANIATNAPNGKFLADTNMVNTASNVVANFTNSVGIIAIVTNAGTLPMKVGNAVLSDTATSLTTAPTNLMLYTSGLFGTPQWFDTSYGLLVLDGFFTGNCDTSKGALSTALSGTAQVGWSPSGSSDTHWLRLSSLANTLGSVGYVRYNTAQAGAQWPWYSNAVMVTQVNCASQAGTAKDFTNSVYFFGLAKTPNTTNSTDGMQWMSRQDWSTNWIAACTAASSTTYFTSTLANAQSSTATFTIYCPVTNYALFYTNGVLAWSNTVNVPGGANLLPFASVYSTTGIGSANANYMYVNYIKALLR